MLKNIFNKFRQLLVIPFSGETELSEFLVNVFQYIKKDSKKIQQANGIRYQKLFNKN